VTDSQARPTHLNPGFNYTALSLIPTITGNAFAASLRTDICPQRKESSSTSHARNPFNPNFFDSAQCLMVRRWRLIGHFPILYNPGFGKPPRRRAQAEARLDLEVSAGRASLSSRGLWGGHALLLYRTLELETLSPNA
jgi:hypothetical protein